MLDLEELGMGGRSLLKIKTYKSLIAEIKKNNVASIKTFQKAGFKKSGLTFIYDINGEPYNST